MIGDDRLLMPEVKCVECGYDLRGTMRDGLCPECGSVAEASLTPRTWLAALLRRISWKKLFYLSLIALGAFVIASTYLEVTSSYYCTNCTRIEHRSHLGFGSTDNERPWITLRSNKRLSPDKKTPLVKYLDPHRKCQHTWCFMGTTGVELGGKWYACAVGSAPDFTSIFRPNDFDKFMKESPAVVTELRQRIQRQEELSEWLFWAYYDWTETKLPSD